MNKISKIILIIIIIFIGFVIVDTIQARIFNHSPFLSIRYNNLADEDSYVDRGILIDTYYCVKEKDMAKVEWHFKGNNFTCPIE
jgi:hypothetical protein